MAFDEAPLEETELRRRLALRLLAALLPIALLVVGLRTTGVVDAIDVEAIREAVQGADAWGIPLFVALYGVGIVAHVPGSVFVGGGVLAFGPAWGLVWCYLGALVGNLLSFGIVRFAGVRPPTRVAWPVLRSLLARLDERPLGAVIAIRTIFPTTAPVNYALAIAGVGLAPYVVGSLIGVLPQLLFTLGLFAFALA
jgi:uncharacterized membrane protein YdjX (TVP38/TMEM64 family)